MESAKCLLRRIMRFFFWMKIFREKFAQPVSKKFKTDNKITSGTLVIDDTIDSLETCRYIPGWESLKVQERA